MEKGVSVSEKRHFRGSYVISIAYTCNNNCKFCYNMGGELIFPRLSLDEIKKEIEKAKNQGYSRIALFGGEPTIQPYFFDILEMATELGLKIRIETNGRMFVYKSFLNKMSNYNLDSFQISLHAHNAKIHDYLTSVPGSFNQTVQGIKNLQAYFPNLPIDTYTVITSKNYRYLPQIAQFISKNFNINCLYFSFLEMSGRALLSPNLSFRFIEARPFLLKTFSWLQSQKKFFRVNKGPICIIPEFWRHFQYEAYLSKRNYKEKICFVCPFNKKCIGFSPEYVRQFGVDDIRLGGLSKEQLKFYFAGLNLKKFTQFNLLKFDSRNNLILRVKKNSQQNESYIKKICKESNIPLYYLEKKKRLVDVWGDFRFTPSVVTKFLKNKSNLNVDEDKLIKTLIRKINKDFNCQLTEKNLILTCGARHALYVSFLLLLRPQDKAIILGNSWGGYRLGIETLGGKVIELPRKIEIEKLKEKIKKNTKIIIINNPSVINLKSLPQKYLKSLLKLCNEKKIYLVVDEIVNYLRPKPFSILSFANVENNNLIVVNSFSKNYFIPHFRSGFLIANKNFIKRAKMVIDFVGFKISPISIQASYIILKNSQKWQKDLAKKIYEKGRY